nr:Krueppel homolog 1 [Aedes albopictus]
MESSILDNSLTNLEDVDNLINSLWNENLISNISEHQLIGVNQWYYNGAPPMGRKQNDKVSIEKDGIAITKANPVLEESPGNLSDAIQKDQFTYSSMSQHPETSTPMWYDYLSDMETVVPVPSFTLSPESQPTVMASSTQNQSSSSAQTQSTSGDLQVYETNGADFRTKPIETDVHRNWSDVMQEDKIEHLHKLQPVQQAHLKPVSSPDLLNEAIITQIPSCKSTSSQRTPLNQLMTTPNVDNLRTQQVQDFPTIAAPSTTSTSNETISPFDAAEPAPGITCAEYFSSAQFTCDYLDELEPSLAYSMPSSSYTQMPSSPICYQVATHPAPVAPIVQAIIPSASNVQLPYGYVLPAVGNSNVYPVREVYRIDTPQPTATEKSNSEKIYGNRKIPYGTEIYCNICKLEFGRKSSFRQHVRQKHQETRPFRCNICGKTYLTERALREHRRNHDPRMKPHKCHSCEKSYRHMKDRDRHFETHHGTPSYVCVIEGCSKAFARRDHMMAHVVCHENRLKRGVEGPEIRAERRKNQAIRRKQMKEYERWSLGMDIDSAHIGFTPV